MSPSAALHDPVFRAYIGIVFGVLLGAGIVLALLQFAFRESNSEAFGKPIAPGSGWRRSPRLVIFAGRMPFIVGVTVLAHFRVQGIRAWLRAGSRSVDDWRGLRRDYCGGSCESAWPVPAIDFLYLVGASC